MAFNPYSLEGKTVLVTGASSGIGKATAIACSRLGAHVIVSGRNSERLQETFSELDGEGHLQIIADLTDEDQIALLAEFVPPLDGFVNNAGVGNSTATLTTTVQMSAGDTLTFDYFYSSENNFDWYRFKANGTEVQKLSGNTNSAWATYTYTAAADGAYTFEWSYSKDSSVNRGEDCVKIDNVAFSGDAGMADGDVDGDGIVSVSDALLAMRGAMGTITLTASQLAHADLDGDGTVTASDALAIMRMAMNG